MRIPATVTGAPSGIGSGGPPVVRSPGVRLGMRGLRPALAPRRGRGPLAARRPVAFLHRRKALLQQFGEVDHLGALARRLGARLCPNLARGLLLDELEQVVAIGVLEA